MNNDQLNSLDECLAAKLEVDEQIEALREKKRAIAARENQLISEEAARQALKKLSPDAIKALQSIAPKGIETGEAFAN
jgi:SMC interacting uncharacterized protein involved in chromosome segregation